MTLRRFRVDLFDRLDWEYKSFEVVAQYSVDVKEYMDKRFDPKFRQRPYNKNDEDSLTIEFIEDVELPIIIER